MKEKKRMLIPVLIALVLSIAFGGVLMIYASPMEDSTLDLSMIPAMDGENIDPEKFDNKGWTVYTQEGPVKTELVPNGYGGFTGLELGQTFYFSRVMTEELDAPTLQIGAVNRTFSIWLDGSLIYTDCPEADNRIGYLRLPMNEWDRSEPINISLPQNYQGKTLTIAQSFPEYSETSTVRAYPASTILYCGYAYESGLIAETFRTALISTAAFLVGILLLALFARSRDWSLLCLALVAFVWMAKQLMGASFFMEYFGTFDNTVSSVLPAVSAAAMLVFLTLRGGSKRGLLWGLMTVNILCAAVWAVALKVFSVGMYGSVSMILTQGTFSSWTAFACLAAVLVLGAVFWRRESWFYRVFIPLALAGIVVSWVVVALFLDKGMVWQKIAVSLGSGQIDYIYFRVLPAVTAAALIAAVAEAIRNEITHRAEQRLMEQRRELARASYENLRSQHEEVMMLRHDMLRHFHTLRDMGSEEKRTEYLENLIGQNEKIRPVVESGNEMLDIILNGKLGAAIDAGIHVEIQRVEAPKKLPLSDPDLCALVMNIVDNAIAAASRSEAQAPYIKLNIHEQDGYLAIACENSAGPQESETEEKEETVPKHGLGLKIVRNTTERYEGVMIFENGADSFKVKIVLPLT